MIILDEIKGAKKITIKKMDSKNNEKEFIFIF